MVCNWSGHFSPSLLTFFPPAERLGDSEKKFEGELFSEKFGVLALMELIEVYWLKRVLVACSTGLVAVERTFIDPASNE